MLIVGQGIAGTLLAWEAEREGRPFQIIDAGLAGAASRVGAGIINPVTGRRWVQTWRVADWRAEALATYRELEQELGVPLVREMRVRRFWRDEAERKRIGARVEAGELQPWLNTSGTDAQGAWIEGAAQIDTAALIVAARARWRAQGRLVEGPLQTTEERPVVWCVGAAVAPGFAAVPWERSKGQIVIGAIAGLNPGVILNAGHWLVPIAPGQARVGSTYERDFSDGSAVTAAAREELSAAAARLAGVPMTVTAQAAGVRVTTPDRRPVVGWHPTRAGWGIFAGLASKGALSAPPLARQWVEHVATGRPFDAEVDVARFAAQLGG